MKQLIIICILLSFCLSCKPVNQNQKVEISEKSENQKFSDTVSIASDKVEYEIVVIEPGFYNWLYGTARPEGYYSQKFLESRNRILVLNWNLRVMQPQQFDPQLYMFRIDYEDNIDYGYKLNYVLYNYFVFFQMKHKQRLGPFIPRI